MPTMRDVAIQAAVSMATVSHVINGTRYVSPALTERVRTVMGQLSYQPDAVARSLRRRETLTIGLLVPSTEIPFFASVAHCIEKAAADQGYNVILCNSEWQISRELRYLNDLLARRVDGLVCISAEMTAAQLSPILESGTPVVMFERQMPGLPLDAVGIDNFAGAYAATTHLLQLGHRRIALVEGLDSSILTMERVEGCRQALKEWGLTLDPTLLARGDYLPESGKVATEAFLALNEPPTAIFAFNDLMALGVLQVLDQHGLRVPEDVAVVGFDGIPLTEYTSPALTTVCQPLPEMAKAAIQLLLDRIQEEGPDEPQFIRLVPDLIIRDSTTRRHPALAGAATLVQAAGA